MAASDGMIAPTAVNEAFVPTELEKSDGLDPTKGTFPGHARVTCAGCETVVPMQLVKFTRTSPADGGMNETNDVPPTAGMVAVPTMGVQEAPLLPENCQTTELT